MRRADRRTASDDHAAKHPKAKPPLPAAVPANELRQLLMTVRADRDEAKGQVLEKTRELEETQQLFQEQRERLESTLVLYQESQEQVTAYLALYTDEKARSSEFEVKYNEARQESENYLALYQQIEQELKVERRSKAGIKSWETRRKRENERLKQEIGQMALLLQDSLGKKDQAIATLEEMAARMDRIQNLVDSVDGEGANNPVGTLQKLQRIWTAIKEILSE